MCGGGRPSVTPLYNEGWLREQVVFSWSTYCVLGTLLGAFHAAQLLMLFMGLYTG